MSISKLIAKNTIYLSIGKAVSTGIGVIALAFLLRYLSPEDYGRYTTALAFVLLFGTFADFGLNLSTTQDISEPGRDIERTMSSIFTGRLIINLCLILILPIVLLFFPYDIKIKQAILITSSLFLTTSLFQVLAAYFQKTLQAGKIAIAELGGRITLLVTTLVAINFKFSFLEIMLTVIVASFIQLGILLKFINKEIPIKFIIDLESWKRIASKTWPIAISVIFTTIYFKGDAVILSLARPYEDVGIYGAAYKILEVLITLPILFMGLILPHLSSAFAQNNIARFNHIIQKSWDAISLATLPLVSGTLVLSDKIINTIAGSEYQSSANVLRILIVATGVIFLGSLFTHAVVAVGMQKKMILYYATAAVLAVLFYIKFIPIYSYYAAATVTVFAELLVACAAAVTVWKISEFKISFKIFFKALIASIIMAGALFVLREANIIILITTGFLIYGLMAKVLKIIPATLIKQ